MYANGGIPLHAHKIVAVGGGNNECESKMGQGPVISHPREMLVSPRRNQPNRREYGRIVVRYRYDWAAYQKWYEDTCKLTRPLRVLPYRHIGGSEGVGG